jgi:hypothetical protein
MVVLELVAPRIAAVSAGVLAGVLAWTRPLRRLTESGVVGGGISRVSEGSAGAGASFRWPSIEMKNKNGWCVRNSDPFFAISVSASRRSH